MLPWLLAAVTSAAVLSLAIVTPLAAFDDCDCGLTAIQRDRLKAQAEHRLELPALRLQVASARADSADPDAGQGVVAVRGPFGIQTGEVRIEGQEDIERSGLKELGSWALLAVAVAAPFGGAALRSGRP